jgi:hypothetical protein
MDLLEYQNMRKFGVTLLAAVLGLGLIGAAGPAQADPPWNHGWGHGDWYHHRWHDHHRGWGWRGPQVYVQAPPPPVYYAPPPPAYYPPPPPPPVYYAPPPPAYYAPPSVSFGLSLPVR